MRYSAVLVLASVLAAGSQLVPAPARADDPQQQLHNITYRARVDGVSRGALITYNISDNQVETANPTMLPGRMFEANTVLADPSHAGMEVSIKWPYSADLHCEILVDDATTAQADHFVAPRVLPANDDPGYGALDCGAPLTTAANGGPGGPGVPGGAAAGTGNVVNTNPIAGPPDAGAPDAGAPGGPPPGGPPLGGPPPAS